MSKQPQVSEKLQVIVQTPLTNHRTQRTIEGLDVEKAAQLLRAIFDATGSAEMHKSEAGGFVLSGLIAGKAKQIIIFPGELTQDNYVRALNIWNQ